MKKIVLILILMLFLQNLVYAAETFTPIFCNDYEFTCCGGEVGPSNYYEISDEESWICPDYAYKCDILSISNPDSVEWYVGSSNCRLESYWYGAHGWKCDDENPHTREMSTGDQVYVRSKTWGSLGDTSSKIEIKITKPFLGFCGRSGSVGEDTTCGVPVSGADGCKFNPINEIVYTSTSSLAGKLQKYSYTVPVGKCVLAFQSGDRHICGYREESCSSDADCGGHTYGTKECSGRELQTYGCRDYGTPINERDRGPFDSGWGSDKPEPSQSGRADFGKRCEIISSEPVQCCGDTDCGTDFFCDKQSFTCREYVECQVDSDCGVSIQCDWKINQLKKPVCESGKCTFEEKEVECCLDENCGEGGFCNSQYKCERSTKSDSSLLSQDDSGIRGAAIGVGSNKSAWIIAIVLVVICGALAAAYFMRKSSSISSDGKCCEDSKKAGKKFCTGCGKKTK